MARARRNGRRGWKDEWTNGRNEKKHETKRIKMCKKRLQWPNWCAIILELSRAPRCERERMHDKCYQQTKYRQTNEGHTRNGKTAKRYRNGKSKRNKNSNNISGQIKYTLHIIWNAFSLDEQKNMVGRCSVALLQFVINIYSRQPKNVSCNFGTGYAHTHKVHTGHEHRAHLPHRTFGKLVVCICGCAAHRWPVVGQTARQHVHNKQKQINIMQMSRKSRCRSEASVN